MRVKNDSTEYKGKLADQFNLVRAKYSGVSEVDFTGEKPFVFLDMGATSYDLAKKSYHAGDKKNAAQMLEHSNTFIDIALGSVPFVGFFKDAYEAYSGKNLISDELLTENERTLAVVGLGVGLLSGGTLGGVVKTLPKLLPYAKKFVQKGKEIFEAAGKLGLKAKEEIQLFTKLAGNNIASVGFIDEFAKSTKSVWNRLGNKGPNWTGSNIPKHFEVTAAGEKFFVNPNATKHINEYVSSYFRSITHSAPIHSQVLLNSFEGSVKSAVKSGNWRKSMETGEVIIQDGWELVFKKQRAGETLPVIKHARKVN